MTNMANTTAKEDIEFESNSVRRLNMTNRAITTTKIKTKGEGGGMRVFDRLFLNFLKYRFCNKRYNIQNNESLFE